MRRRASFGRSVPRAGLALLAVAGAVLAALAVLLAFEVRTPGEVPWRPVELQGLAGQRAEGLVLQQEDGGDVWATQGYAIYLSEDGGPFRKRYTLRPRLGEAWGGFSRTLRRRFGYQELVELLPVGGDRVVAFAGGDVYRVDLAKSTQERVHRLRYFGRGQGRGVMAHGLTKDAQGRLFYGEYPTRPGPQDYDVRIWRSDDEGRSWQVAHEFPPGATRHVHGVQHDPYGGGLWTGTGDTDDRSRLGYSLDGGASFRWIGGGSQEFRVVSVLFLQGAVAWVMDADTERVGALRWRRADGGIERSATTLPGPGYFARALDETHGIVGLAELDVSLWLLGDRGEPRRLLQWTLPRPARPGPHPAIRLARAGALPAGFVHVNPLRTIEEEAAIYRFPVSAFLEPHAGTP